MENRIYNLCDMVKICPSVVAELEERNRKEEVEYIIKRSFYPILTLTKDNYLKLEKIDLGK